MRWRSFALVVLAVFAACEKPNLEPTEGGYRGRRVAQATAAAAEPATAADTAAPAAADTATP